MLDPCGTGVAGTGFGNLAIPRVGQEVIVDSSTATRTSRLLWGVPTTMKTHTRQPAGDEDADDDPLENLKGSGFNELKFDDATGKEQV